MGLSVISINQTDKSPPESQLCPRPAVPVACLCPAFDWAPRSDNVTVAEVKFSSNFGSTLPSTGQSDEEPERPAVACAGCHSCAIK